jgi:hypothetical protein
MWLSASRIGHIQHSPQQVCGAVTARRNVVTPSIPKPSIALRWLIRWQRSKRSSVRLSGQSKTN